MSDNFPFTSDCVSPHGDILEYSVVHCGSDIFKCCTFKWLLSPWEDLSRHQWRGNSFQDLETFSEFFWLICFFWIFMALSISDSHFSLIVLWFLYYILILIVSLLCLFTWEFLQIVLPYSLLIFSFHCLISHYNILCLSWMIVVMCWFEWNNFLFLRFLATLFFSYVDSVFIKFLSFFLSFGFCIRLEASFLRSRLTMLLYSYFSIQQWGSNK